jgi:hypothetical protein
LQPEKLKACRSRDGNVPQRCGELPGRLAPTVGRRELLQRFEDPVADCAGQLVTAPEVAVEGHFLDAELRAEGAHAERGGAVAFDQGHGGVDDQLAVQPPLEATARWGWLGHPRHCHSQLYTVKIGPPAGKAGILNEDLTDHPERLAVNHDGWLSLSRPRFASPRPGVRRPERGG